MHYNKTTDPYKKLTHTWNLVNTGTNSGRDPIWKFIVNRSPGNELDLGIASTAN